MKRPIEFLSMLALSVAAFGAAGAQDKEPIRVGVLYPTSGFGQIFGAPALVGHNMMIDKINAAGGINGRKIVSFHRDSKLKPEEATAAARDLIAKDKVHFLIGGVSSSEGQAISEVAKQERVVYIATVPKTTEMTDKKNFHKYVFRTAANTNTEGKSAAIIAAQLGMNKICTILMDYSYGHSLDEAFKAHIKVVRPQAQIVYQAWPKQGTTDYTSYITSIMNAGCDGVYSGVWGGLFVAFAKQAKTFGLFQKVKYVSAGEIGSPEVAEQLGDDMPDGIWGNSYDVFYYPNTPEHKAYVEDLKKKTGKEHPSSWPITGYIGMLFLAEGIKKAGKTDADAVIQALEGLTVNTPIGQQTIRASDHQANRGQVWGPMGKSDIPKYPYKIMKPAQYIPADKIMD